MKNDWMSPKNRVRHGVHNSHKRPVERSAHSVNAGVIKKRTAIKKAGDVADRMNQWIGHDLRDIITHERVGQTTKEHHRPKYGD